MSSQTVIENWAKYYGIPASIPLTIAQEESSLNPAAQGDLVNGQPTSFGLFQLHQGNGQGAGFTSSQLLEPNLNSQIGIANMVTPYQQGAAKGLTGYSLVQYVAAHSGHPTETGFMPASYNAGLAKAYTTITGQKAVGAALAGNGVQTGKLAIQAPTGISGAIQSVGWLIAGIVVVGLGIYIAFNPFADLTTTLRKMGQGALQSHRQGLTRRLTPSPHKPPESEGEEPNAARTRARYGDA